MRHVCESIYKDGVFLGISGSNIDITKRKTLEKALFEKNKALAVILESIGDGVITTDINGRITLNRAAQKITGWGQNEAMKRPLQDVFNIINEKTGKPCKKPCRSCAPIKDKDNQVIGAVLGEYIPCQNVHGRGFQDLDQARCVEKGVPKGQGTRGSAPDFIKDRAPVKKTTPIVEILKESAAFALQDTNVNCAFNIEKDIPPVEVDPNQISQIINNINYINANQAMPDGGTIGGL
ncbi:MAG: PAS domain S-box protein [Dissulfurimicrobium sp.]|uniref:PAS domain S-box protein n=1 Tax=Dissulfurimicrobium sp. TaxID=2022436 RepID=UPI004049FF0B